MARVLLELQPSRASILLRCPVKMCHIIEAFYIVKTNNRTLNYNQITCWFISKIAQFQRFERQGTISSSVWGNSFYIL